MKLHNFEIHGGNKIVKGKSNWPGCLCIEMDNYFAWDLAESILRQLHDNSNGEKTIIYSTVGKLDCDINDE